MRGGGAPGEADVGCSITDSKEVWGLPLGGICIWLLPGLLSELGTAGVTWGSVRWWLISTRWVLWLTHHHPDNRSLFTLADKCFSCDRLRLCYMRWELPDSLICFCRERKCVSPMWPIFLCFLTSVMLMQCVLVSLLNNEWLKHYRDPSVDWVEHYCDNAFCTLFQWQRVTSFQNLWKNVELVCFLINKLKNQVYNFSESLPFRQSCSANKESLWLYLCQCVLFFLFWLFSAMPSFDPQSSWNYLDLASSAVLSYDLKDGHDFLFCISGMCNIFSKIRKNIWALEWAYFE